jgi:hypothetical protein
VIPGQAMGDDAGGDVDERQKHATENRTDGVVVERPGDLNDRVGEHSDGEDEHHGADGHARPRDGDDADGKAEEAPPEQRRPR